MCAYTCVKEGGGFRGAERRPQRRPLHAVKTPDIDLARVTLSRDGEEIVVVEHFKPSKFVERLL